MFRTIESAELGSGHLKDKNSVKPNLDYVPDFRSEEDFCPYCNSPMLCLELDDDIDPGAESGSICLVCGHATAEFLVGW